MLVFGSVSSSEPSSATYIERGADRIRLIHCSSVLEAFVLTMDRIEADFTRRFGGAPTIART
jgi:hypothetical protein